MKLRSWTWIHRQIKNYKWMDSCKLSSLARVFGLKNLNQGKTKMLIGHSNSDKSLKTKRRKMKRFQSSWATKSVFISNLFPSSSPLEQKMMLVQSSQNCLVKPQRRTLTHQLFEHRIQLIVATTDSSKMSRLIYLIKTNAAKSCKMKTWYFSHLWVKRRQRKKYTKTASLSWLITLSMSSTRNKPRWLE